MIQTSHPPGAPPLADFGRAVKRPVEVRYWLNDTNSSIDVQTAEGTMRCRPGDYLLRGTKGEYYLCRADVFEEAYDALPRA